MIGLSAVGESTLLDRAMQLLRHGPVPAEQVCGTVMGMPAAPRMVAERLTVALLGADPRVRQMADGRWGLVAQAQDSPCLDACTFAVVDVETTGMRARGGDRITEVAVVVVQGHRRELVFDSLVNPERAIPSAIARITNISDAMVREAPTFSEVADRIVAALSGRVFVAHNARFDWSFVSAELARARALMLDGPQLCTVRLARKLVREVRSCGLDNLTQHFALANPARHRAAGDALATADLLSILLMRAREQGAHTFQDLEALCSTRSRAARKRRSPLPTPPLADSVPEGPA